MLEKMNAAGFPPAMTVPEVLVKVRGLSLILALATLRSNYPLSYAIEASAVEGYYYCYYRYLFIKSVLMLWHNI